MQWNAITNRPGSLRGVHWHNAHADFIAPVHGSVLVAAIDLRIGSPTEGRAELAMLDAAEPRAIVIPPGVGHGFFSAEASVVMYGVSKYWDPDDELGVRWDDPALGIPWPPEASGALVSGRDAGFPTLAEAGERLTLAELAEREAVGLGAWGFERDLERAVLIDPGWRIS